MAKAIKHKIFVNKVANHKKPKLPQQMITKAQQIPDNPNIAIIQTASWGDNINSTLMLQPIKTKWPNCKIDVFTSNRYASAFHHNPHISNLYEEPVQNKTEAMTSAIKWGQKINPAQYPLIINAHPFYNPEKRNSLQHPHLGDNLILSWVRALEEAGIEYTMPLKTELCFNQNEIDKANQFLSQMPNKPKVLMEIYGESGQSFWDHNWTIAVTELLASKGYCVIHSRCHDGPDLHQLRQRFTDVYFAGSLSIRECAALYEKCDMFFCISSGLMNACNASTRRIPWFEVINSYMVSSTPLSKENKNVWMENNITNFINFLKEKV